MTPRLAFDRNGVQLWHGDARDVLDRVGNAGLLLTDPPYGVEATTTGRRTVALAQSTIANDRPADRGVVDEVLRRAWERLDLFRHAYVFGPFDLAALPLASGVTELVWDKELLGAGDTALGWAPSHERIAFAVRNDCKVPRGGALARMRRGTVLRYQRPNAGQVKHPTQKPVALLRELIEMSSRAGDVVLDPFAGSGSTLLAAIAEGRRAIGIEIDECWVDTAVRRLEAATRQRGLFDAVLDGEPEFA